MLLAEKAGVLTTRQAYMQLADKAGVLTTRPTCCLLRKQAY